MTDQRTYENAFIIYRPVFGYIFILKENMPRELWFVTLDDIYVEIYIDLTNFTSFYFHYPHRNIK